MSLDSHFLLQAHVLQVQCVTENTFLKNVAFTLTQIKLEYQKCKTDILSQTFFEKTIRGPIFSREHWFSIRQ